MYLISHVLDQRPASLLWEEYLGVVLLIILFSNNSCLVSTVHYTQHSTSAACRKPFLPHFFRSCDPYHQGFYTGTQSSAVLGDGLDHGSNKAPSLFLLQYLFSFSKSNQLIDNSCLFSLSLLSQSLQSHNGVKYYYARGMCRMRFPFLSHIRETGVRR